MKEGDVMELPTGDDAVTAFVQAYCMAPEGTKVALGLGRAETPAAAIVILAEVCEVRCCMTLPRAVALMISLSLTAGVAAPGAPEAPAMATLAAKLSEVLAMARDLLPPEGATRH